MNPLHEHLNGVPGPLYGVHRGKCVAPVSKYLQTPLQIGGRRAGAEPRRDNEPLDG